MIKSRYLATAMMILPLAFGGLASTPTMAQQITGTPGSPSATTTIQGNQIPAPEPKFGGVIKENSRDSKPWWPPAIVPPKGAPNILLIMTDDQGYGVSGTFGGVIGVKGPGGLKPGDISGVDINVRRVAAAGRISLINGPAALFLTARGSQYQQKEYQTGIFSAIHLK